MPYFMHVRQLVAIFEGIENCRMYGKGAKTGRTKKPGYLVCISYKKQIYVLQYTAYLYGVAIFYAMMIFTI